MACTCVEWTTHALRGGTMCGMDGLCLEGKTLCAMDGPCLVEKICVSNGRPMPGWEDLVWNGPLMVVWNGRTILYDATLVV